MWRERNEHMLHYEQVFGNVFESWESECCAVLMKHRHKVKGEQVLIVQMDQQLKTKNISDVSKQLFCCQCKDKFLLLLKTVQCKKNGKQHHVQNQSKFLTWYLINDLECAVQNILISLFELQMKSKK